MKKNREIIKFYIIIASISYLGVELFFRLTSPNTPSFLAKYRLVLIIGIIFICNFSIMLKYISNIYDEQEFHDQLNELLVKKQNELHEISDLLIDDNMKLNLLLKKISKQSSFLDKILHLLPESIFVTDENKKIKYYNEKFENLFSTSIKKDMSIQALEGKSSIFDIENQITKHEVLIDSNQIDCEWIEKNHYQMKKHLFKMKNQIYVLTSIKSIKHLNESNKILNDKIKELKKTYREVDLVNDKVYSIIDFLFSLQNIDQIEMDVFLSKSLKFFLDIFEEFDYGAVYLFDENRVRYIDAVGHNLNKLQKIPMMKESLVLSDQREPEVFESILSRVPKYFRKELYEASKPIKSTVKMPILRGDLIIGYLTLDIDQDSERKIVDSTLKVIRVYHRLVNSIINLVEKKRSNNQYIESLFYGFINVLDIHLKEGKKHSLNVASLSKKFANYLHLPNAERIYWAGLMHDIGLILIPSEKVETENRERISEYRNHPQQAAEVLGTIENLKDIAEIIRYHHENYDGSGYPLGIKGDKIPLSSQILQLVNFYDFQLSIEQHSEPDVKALILKNKGIKFSETLADAFINFLEEVNYDA